MRRKAQTEGCIAGLRWKYPAGSGRALPPCFAGCVAAGRVRRPGRVLPRQGAAPLRRLRRHLPLQGRLPGRQRTKRLPCKGSWMRRKAQTEGCIAGWRRNYLARSGRALPYVSQRAVLASSPQTLRRPAVPGFAARVPYIVGRAFTPAGEEVAAMGTGWALCSALPRSTRRCRKAPRRARSPTLHYGRKRAATRKRQPSLRPDGGPMQASAPTQGRAAAGRVRLPGRVFARPGAAPLRRLRRHLPLQGRLLGAAAQKGSPARGAGCAGRRRLRGALPVGVGTIWQGLAEPCPMFLRGRCSHLPRKPCGGPLFPVLPPVCLIL